MEKNAIDVNREAAVDMQGGKVVKVRFCARQIGLGRKILHAKDCINIVTPFTMRKITPFFSYFGAVEVALNMTWTIDSHKCSAKTYKK